MEHKDLQTIDLLPQLAERVIGSVSRQVVSHEETTRLLLGAFIIGGHVLLEGPPGIAKTLLARTFAKSLDLNFNRIQFTPDLMPSDITGLNILDTGSQTFRFVPGPIHSDIVLADEINRTPPKTQSALLEAMEEKQITIDGLRHALSKNFFVIATQNPIEHEGTFPLPEAQLDRFLFRINLSYPPTDLEAKMIQSLSSENPSLGSVISIGSGVSLVDIDYARELIRKVSISEAVLDYLMRIINATREHPQIMLGVSPRGALNLALAAKYEAAFDNRTYLIPDDIKKVASLVICHRLVLKPDAYESADSSYQIVQQILARVQPPSKAASE